jgi:hypothetical protein
MRGQRVILSKQAISGSAPRRRPALRIRSVANSSPIPPRDRGRVLPFRRRGGARHFGWSRLGGDAETGAPLIDDLSKYERTDVQDDYRHRMVVNLLALAFTAMLVLAGVWLAGKVVEIRKNQDCVLSGQRNCNAIEVPAQRS